MKYEMSWDDYVADPRMNASTLVHGFKSLLSLKNAIDGRVPEPTSEMDFGHHYHSLILEPSSFRLTHVVMPDFAKSRGNVDRFGNPSTKGNTKWVSGAKAEFYRQHAGKSVIDQAKFDRALAMIDAINSNPKARQIIDRSMKEVVVTGRISQTEFKGRVDLVGDEIGDIKGTNNVAPPLFGGLGCRLHYPEKMSIYRELVRQETSKTLPVYLIAIETDGDFDCAVYELPEILLDQAFERVESLVKRYEMAKRTNHWPGVDGGTEVLQFHVPNWYMPIDGDGLDWGDVA